MLNPASTELRRTGLNKPRLFRQRGVGLIEIMVSVVLIAIGFLAAAQMQIQGMRFSQSAYFQSQAYFLASDMIDRMRSNTGGVDDGEYDNVSTSASAINPDCANNACTPAGNAAQDIYDWSTHLYPLEGGSNFVAALPEATGTVQSIGNGIYAVNLSWSEDVEGSSQTQTLTINFATEIPQ